MIPVLLIVIPLVSGLASFAIKNDRAVRSWALISSIATMAVSLLGLTILNKGSYLQFHASWISSINTSFSVKLDGMGQILCLLTAVSFPLVFISTWNSQYKRPNNFFALMLLMQVGLMGVFVAMDALLFYFFWELALIPAYFLCSQWGGERRVAVTLKFFIYTFTGSILMLVAIIYIYLATPDHSFDISAFYDAPVNTGKESWLFWLMATKFKPPEPVEVNTPKSVSTTELPESNAVLITIDKENKVYFTALSQKDQSVYTTMMNDLNSSRNLGLTPAEISNYRKTYLAGVAFTQLKQLLDMPEDQQKNLKQPGIPIDTTGGELTYWIQSAKSAFAGQQLKFLIKGDNNSKYPTFKNVIEALKKNDVYKYNLITAPEDAPVGTELYDQRLKR